MNIQKIKGSNRMRNQMFEVKGKELIGVLRQLLKKGNATHIVVQKDKQVLCNLPVTAVALGTLWAPLLIGLSVGVILANDYQVFVKKK